MIDLYVMDFFHNHCCMFSFPFLQKWIKFWLFPFDNVGASMHFTHIICVCDCNKKFICIDIVFWQICVLLQYVCVCIKIIYNILFQNICRPSWFHIFDILISFQPLCFHFIWTWWFTTMFIVKNSMGRQNNFPSLNWQLNLCSNPPLVWMKHKLHKANEQG